MLAEPAHAVGIVKGTLIERTIQESFVDAAADFGTNSRFDMHTHKTPAMSDVESIFIISNEVMDDGVAPLD
jgi:hypothetical protein